MKVVKLTGGLGNQMFQYAFACLLERTTGEEVKLDDSLYELDWNDGIRIPRIKRFNLSLDMASKQDIKAILPLYRWEGCKGRVRRKLAGIAHNRSPKCYREGKGFDDIDQLNQYSYFQGYWARPEYVEAVRDRLYRDFTPNYRLSDKTSLVIDELSQRNSVLLGVRRGDYLDNPLLGVLGKEYYLQAMKMLSDRYEGLTFCVFSNDIVWCKRTFSDSGFGIVYREEDDIADDFEELFVMGACKHAIISNSTFHWWGVYFMNNPEKIVMCPKPWHANGSGEGVVLDGWQRICRSE